jgi:hypothetical protein
MFIGVEEVEITVRETRQLVKIEFKDPEIDGYWFVKLQEYINNIDGYIEKEIYSYIKESKDISSCYLDFFTY